MVPFAFVSLTALSLSPYWAGGSSVVPEPVTKTVEGQLSTMQGLLALFFPQTLCNQPLLDR